MNEQIVAGYLDGELDLVRKIEVEEHLQTCDICARELESLRELRSAIRRGALTYEAPAQLRERIAAALPNSRASAPPSRARISFWPVWQSAVSFALLVIGVFIGWRVLPQR